MRGRLAGRPLTVVVTGDGERNARRGVRALEAVAPSRLLVIGVAGALAPDLPPGSLVVGARVIGEDGATFVAEPELVDLAAAAGARVGVVATTRRILDTPEAKAALRERAARNGAPPPGAAAGRGRAAGLPDVVDMESAIYAAAASRLALPWVVVRSVSDGARERLPAWLDRCRDEGGAVRRGEVFGRALARPWTLPALLRLRGTVRRGGERLAGVVEAVLAGPGADETGR